MKERHKSGWRIEARAFLQNINAHIGQDYHTLTSSQVDLVLEAAVRFKYQKPKNANGSRARYFYNLMQRRAS